MQLRMTLAELGMPSIPSLLPVPRVQEAFTPDGEPTDPRFEHRAERFFREFEWYAEALRRARPAGGPCWPNAAGAFRSERSVEDFERRLGGAHRDAIDRHHVLRAGGEDNVGMLSRPARTMRGNAGCGNQLGTAALLPGSSGLNREKLISALFRNLCGSS